MAAAAQLFTRWLAAQAPFLGFVGGLAAISVGAGMFSLRYGLIVGGSLASWWSLVYFVGTARQQSQADR